MTKKYTKKKQNKKKVQSLPSKKMLCTVHLLYSSYLLNYFIQTFYLGVGSAFSPQKKYGRNFLGRSYLKIFKMAITVSRHFLMFFFLSLEICIYFVKAVGTVIYILVIATMFVTRPRTEHGLLCNFRKSMLSMLNQRSWLDKWHRRK